MSFSFRCNNITCGWIFLETGRTIFCLIYFRIRRRLTQMAFLGAALDFTQCIKKNLRRELGIVRRLSAIAWPFQANSIDISHSSLRLSVSEIVSETRSRTEHPDARPETISGMERPRDECDISIESAWNNEFIGVIFKLIRTQLEKNVFERA